MSLKGSSWSWKRTGLKVNKNFERTEFTAKVNVTQSYILISLFLVIIYTVRLATQSYGPSAPRDTAAPKCPPLCPVGPGILQPATRASLENIGSLTPVLKNASDNSYRNEEAYVRQSGLGRGI